jgi:hypothetical protein
MTATKKAVEFVANILSEKGKSDGNHEIGIDFYLMVAKTMLECDQIKLENENPLFKLLNEDTKNLVTAERLKMRL